MTIAFEVLIFAPLPILLLSSPVSFLKEWFIHQYNVRRIKRYYSDLEVVGVNELKQIFPRKSSDQLEEIALKLNELNLSYKN